MLNQQAIDELKQIYKEEYGKDLPDAQAWEMGNRLLRIFAIMTRPRPEPGEVTPPTQEPTDQPAHVEPLTGGQLQLPL